VIWPCTVTSWKSAVISGKMKGAFTLPVGTTTIELDGAKYQKARPAPSRRGLPSRYWITYWVGWVLMKRNPNMVVSLEVARRPRRW
jgi:hypothetical protein